MIYLYHGYDLISSRKAVPDGVWRYDVSEITPELWEQLNTGNQLFSQSPDIYLWAGKKLPLTQLKRFSGAKIKEFPVRRVIWQFLKTRRLKDLTGCLAAEPVELVWYLLHRDAAKKGQKELLIKMFQIELAVKSGRSILPLRNHLELLLL